LADSTVSTHRQAPSGSATSSDMAARATGPRWLHATRRLALRSAALIPFLPTALSILILITAPPPTTIYLLDQTAQVSAPGANNLLSSVLSGSQIAGGNFSLWTYGPVAPTNHSCPPATAMVPLSRSTFFKSAAQVTLLGERPDGQSSLEGAVVQTLEQLRKVRGSKRLVIITFGPSPTCDNNVAFPRGPIENLWNLASSIEVRLCYVTQTATGDSFIDALGLELHANVRTVDLNNVRSCATFPAYLTPPFGYK
jgi:hypothetical protein